METEKKKRGRPATGIKRNKKLTIMFSESELQTVKTFQKKYNVTVANFILDSIKKIEKK